MTRRVAGIVITLAEDAREDEPRLKAMLDVLQTIDGVVSVETVTGDVDIHLAEQRARYDLESRLLKVLREAS